MSYRYELHCHSKEGSACSKISALDLVKFYQDYGYSGLCLTDHFTGNPTISEEYSWETRVKRFYDIYENAREEGLKTGFQVFFGLEYAVVGEPGNLTNIKGSHHLILGLDKDWWLEREFIFRMPPVKTFAAIREAGGFLIHAHPFHEAKWIEHISLFPSSHEAVEVVNGHLPPELNARALAYAQSYGLLQVAGTDTHAAVTDFPLCGVETETLCNTIHELIKAIREGAARPFSQKY